MKPAFAADRSLGKLVKWLRLMGFDTVYEADATGGRFRRLSGTRRVLLTRTRRWLTVQPAERLLWIDENDPWLQVRQVVSRMGLTAEDVEPFTRCLRCNEPITALSKAAANGLVPDYIWETHQEFGQCRGCGRIFWPGSHTRRSRNRMATLFEGRR